MRQHFLRQGADFPLGPAAGAQLQKVQKLPAVHFQHQVDYLTRQGQIPRLFHRQARRQQFPGQGRLLTESVLIQGPQGGIGLDRLR